jgi:hypothetical protein
MDFLILSFPVKHTCNSIVNKQAASCFCFSAVIVMLKVCFSVTDIYW